MQRKGIRPLGETARLALDLLCSLSQRGGPSEADGSLRRWYGGRLLYLLWHWSGRLGERLALINNAVGGGESSVA